MFNKGAKKQIKMDNYPIRIMIIIVTIAKTLQSYLKANICSAAKVAKILLIEIKTMRNSFKSRSNTTDTFVSKSY